MAQGTAADLMSARRVLCYGVTGSGKSTAAVRLGGALGLPVHLVDEEIGWLPGWVQRPADDQRAITDRLVAEDTWVFDSAWSTMLPAVLSRAEVVVALDYPRWVSLGHLLRRTVTRAITREEMCNGNTESWQQALSNDSILAWHVRSYARKRDRIRSWAADPTFLPVVRLTAPRDLDRLLDAVGARS